MFWQTTRFAIDVTSPKVMGIINVTPDSFAGGDAGLDVEGARAHCARLVDEGADLIDIGGESTRPGASLVPLQVELDRVLPVIEFALGLGVPVSVDTRTPQVMQSALQLGVDIVNDVNALRAPQALQVVGSHPTCGVCLMHMPADPAAMLQPPSYADVVGEVAAFLQERSATLQQAGIDAARLVLDPGIGFGKLADDNLELLRRQRELLALGRPLLVGWSRKSTLGKLTGRAVGERVAASVAAAIMSVERGARVVRVHDVAATVDALAVWRACQAPNNPS